VIQISSTGLPAHAFDARGVAKRFRHAAIFGALESLNQGETMRFVNDHDPLPLLDQIVRRYGPQIEMAYVAKDPGCIVIDFTIQPDGSGGIQEPVAAGSGCGSGGCGCSGSR